MGQGKVLEQGTLPLLHTVELTLKLGPALGRGRGLTVLGVFLVQFLVVWDAGLGKLLVVAFEERLAAATTHRETAVGREGHRGRLVVAQHHIGPQGQAGVGGIEGAQARRLQRAAQHKPAVFDHHRVHCAVLLKRECAQKEFLAIIFVEPGAADHIVNRRCRQAEGHAEHEPQP